MGLLVESPNPLCWVVLSSLNALGLGPWGILRSEAETSALTQTGATQLAGE